MFLDRDGVIKVDHGYVWQPERFEVLPGVFEALRAAQALDYALIVVTNQSGIARGYYSEEDYARLEAHMRSVFASEGVTFEGIYHCPHSLEVDGATPCACRKPQPGMILRAAADHAIDLALSILVGDKASDLAAASAVGVGRAYRVGEAADSRSLADVVRSLEISAPSEKEGLSAVSPSTQE